MFKILGGDFPSFAGFVSIRGQDLLKWGFGDKKYELNGNIESVEVITEENKKKFAGSAGWGLAGGLLLGPLGLLAGALAGGNKKEIAFAVYLKDGRKFMAKADPKTYQKIMVSSMK